VHRSSEAAVENILPEERLVETPLLTRCHCKYNTRYDLIVCNLCEEGVPLRILHKHVSDPIRHKHIIRGGKLTFVPISHGFRVSKDPAMFTSQIEAEILAVLPGATIRDADSDGAWSKPAEPLPGQLDPILGLQVFEDAWMCGACEIYASPSKDAVYSHRSRGCQAVKESRGARAAFECRAQTFSSYKKRVFFFRVYRNGADTREGVKQTQAQPSTGAARHLRKRLAAITGAYISSDPQCDSRAVHQFYVESGIHSFLHKFPRQYLLDVIKMPHLRGQNTDSRLKRLWQIVGVTFLADCDKVLPADLAFRHAIMDCAPYVQQLILSLLFTF